MDLRPKKFFYKNKFKIRKFLSFKKSSLSYGSAGLLLKHNLFFNSRHMTRFKTFLKKLNKKSERTKRKLLFKTFPYFPLTKKSQGLRMGKGKGKFCNWFAKVRSGSILIEVRNIRPGRVKFFFTQFNYMLRVNGRVIFKSPQYIIGGSVFKHRLFL